MFKPETISKNVRDMNRRTRHYVSRILKAGPGRHGVTAAVGKKNSKVPCEFFSFPPVLSCPDCEHCKGYCYAMKAAARFDAYRDARARNYALWLADPDGLFRQLYQVLARISRRKNPEKRSFRWMESGDIPIIDGPGFFARMVRAAWDFPNVRFWGYTKNDDVVNAFERDHGGRRLIDIVPNLSIMRSPAPGRTFENPYGDPAFNISFTGTGDDVPPCMRCPGACIVCLSAGVGCPAAMDVWNAVH